MPLHVLPPAENLTYQSRDLKTPARHQIADVTEILFIRQERNEITVVAPEMLRWISWFYLVLITGDKHHTPHLR